MRIFFIIEHRNPELHTHNGGTDASVTNKHVVLYHHQGHCGHPPGNVTNITTTFPSRPS